MKFQRMSCPQSEVHLSFSKLLQKCQHWKENGFECVFPTFSSCDFKASGLLQEKKDCVFWRIIHMYRYLQISPLLLVTYLWKGEQSTKKMTLSNVGFTELSTCTSINVNNLLLWGFRQKTNKQKKLLITKFSVSTANSQGLPYLESGLVPSVKEDSSRLMTHSLPEL